MIQKHDSMDSGPTRSNTVTLILVPASELLAAFAMRRSLRGTRRGDGSKLER
jgi:hypothetical protein